MSWQVKQRINFYSDEFRPPQLPAQVATLLLALGGMAAAMAGSLKGPALEQQPIG